jgi:hypothetical protein
VVGTDVTITVQIVNLGLVSENSTVVAIVGEQTIAQKNVTLAPGQNMNVTFTWKTSGFEPKAYMIGGKILAVSGETNTGNNEYRQATPVTLTSANTNAFTSGVVLPLVAIAAVIAAGAMGTFFYILPRRRIATTQ